MDFSDALKKVILAGIGAVATTTEAAKDLVDQFVEKGEITLEQGKVLNEELKSNVRDKVKDHVTVNIVKEYKDVMNAVDSMSKEERDELRIRLDAADAADATAEAAEEDESAANTAEECSETAEDVSSCSAQSSNQDCSCN